MLDLYCKLKIAALCLWLALAAIGIIRLLWERR